MPRHHRILFLILLFGAPLTSALADPLLTDGGDDILIQDIERSTASAELVTMADGTLFSAQSEIGDAAPFYHSLVIYRSGDGGTTWTLWDKMTAPSGDSLSLTKLYLAEGTVSRLYVLYIHDPDAGDTELNVRWSDPNLTTPVWTERTIASDPLLPVRHADMDSDVAAFSSFYLGRYAWTGSGSGTRAPESAQAIDNGRSVWYNPGEKKWGSGLGRVDYAVGIPIRSQKLTRSEYSATFAGRCLE